MEAVLRFHQPTGGSGACGEDAGAGRIPHAAAAAGRQSFIADPGGGVLGLALAEHLAHLADGAVKAIGTRDRVSGVVPGSSASRNVSAGRARPPPKRICAVPDHRQQARVGDAPVHADPEANPLAVLIVAIF
jgi:hypothetical protein